MPYRRLDDGCIVQIGGCIGCIERVSDMSIDMLVIAPRVVDAYGSLAGDAGEGVMLGSPAWRGMLFGTVYYRLRRV